MFDLGTWIDSGTIYQDLKYKTKIMSGKYARMSFILGFIRFVTKG